MRVPLQISFQNVKHSKAIKELIEKKADKLNQFHSRITSCRVSVEKDQNSSKTANPHRVRLYVNIPPTHEIVVVESPKEEHQELDLFTLIRRAFRAARMKIIEIKEKQNGNVKLHSREKVQGVITKLFPDREYGFILDLDGRDVYFHRNSVVNHDFNRLTLGTGVSFESEQGDKGPQAIYVKIEDKPGSISNWPESNHYSN